MLGQLQIRHHLHQTHRDRMLMRRCRLSGCMLATPCEALSREVANKSLGGAPMPLFSMPNHSIRLSPSPRPSSLLPRRNGDSRSLASSDSPTGSTQARQPKYWICIRPPLRICHSLGSSSLCQGFCLVQCPSNSQHRSFTHPYVQEPIRHICYSSRVFDQCRIQLH